MPELVAPPRGTRPRNRRALILAAAAQLFAERGYDQVSVGDIAAAVGIGPSALYRHFSGKQDLLRDVVSAGIAPIRDLVDDVDLREPGPALRRMAAAALDERHFGVLWQRESRHLAEPDRTAALAELRATYDGLTARVRAARPDLSAPAAGVLTATMVSVLGSPSFHHVDLPRPAFEELLAELARTVLETPLPADFPAAPPARPAAALRPASRREALLSEAIRLFAARGYAAVGTEDIAAAVGIAGPSIYNHFGSKMELLTVAVRRGTETLFTELAAAYRLAADAPDALRRLIRSYVDFTAANHDLVGLLISESRHLPEAEQQGGRHAQHDYVGEWVHLLRQVDPEMGPAGARIRVHAVLGTANDAARTSQLRRSPRVRPALCTIGARLLALPTDVSSAQV